jgi:hypothetical protein
MEDVLDVYQRPLDPKRPLVCLDEGSKQLLDDSRPPLPMQPKEDERAGHPVREDYEYVREGMCSFFMTFAPLLSLRHIFVTERRTAVDYASVIKDLVDVQFPDAEKIVLVQDNLNTHTAASLYEAFEPAEAKRLADKLEFHYTPKHGSWLNQAEIAISLFSRQCLGHRRIGNRTSLHNETRAWSRRMNRHPIPIHWGFTRKKARNTFGY